MKKVGYPEKWKGNFHQYEIKTLRVNEKGEVKEVNLLEE